MKHLLLLCSVLLLVHPAWADNAAMSDNSVVQPCTTCHNCPTPTKEQTCLKGCLRHTTENKGTRVQEQPSDMLLINSLPGIYGAVNFPHKLHAQMAEMAEGCEICHHHSGSDATIKKCSECHTIASQKANLRLPGLRGAYHRQCLGCHREWSHTTRCAACHNQKNSQAQDEHIPDHTDIIGSKHPPITAPGKKIYETGYEDGKLVSFYHDDHAERFGIKCVACHVKENCNRCHESAYRESTKNTDTTTISKNTEPHQACENCHKEDNCERCHDIQERLAFDHGKKSDWILKIYHRKVTCPECHKAQMELKKPPRDCQNCHTQDFGSNFKHDITGLELDENHREFECSECHPPKSFYGKVSCSGCHEDLSYPQNIPGKKANSEKSEKKE